MKIAYLSTFYPFRGGIAQFNASLLREFENQGHEVQAFTFKRQYPNFLFPGETQYVTEKDKVDEIDSLEVLDTINPLSYFSTARRIKEFEPDILVMKYWMSFFGPSLGTVAKRMLPKTKVITVLDNVIPHEKRIIDEPFTKYFLKHNDGFVSMSDKVKADLLSFRPEVPNIRIDHPLYDHFGAKTDQKEAQARLNISTDLKTILFFGFIRDYKGLDLLIEAFNVLDDSYQLVVAGETYGSFDKYQTLVDKNKNKDRIHLHNHYIGDEMVPDYFCAADVCLLPYKSATQSGINSISYHFELPMIATNVGGLKETILHEKNGLIVEKPDSQQIAQSIKRYFEEDLKPKFVGELKNLKEELSWKNFAAKLVEFSKSF